jgi:hypothetical protein
MASYAFHSSGVELHESEVAKPSPLRIVKRSQTVSDSSSSRETFGGRRGLSGESDQSMGTPPGGDRPITVRKKRITRASISDWGLDEPPSEMNSENSNSVKANRVNGELAFPKLQTLFLTH